MSTSLRTGVFVDVENVNCNGGRAMSYAVLADFARRDGGEALRMNAYLAFDEDRARDDTGYRERAMRYHFALRASGFKVIEKKVRWYRTEEGKMVSKANSDLDLGVDMLLQSNKLDRVILLSGDGDFVQVVRAVQNLGCRVELVAFQNVSYDLRRECDFFLSGYLVPNLVSVPGKAPAWGQEASRVRGTCYYFNPEKGFGFFRCLIGVDNLHLTEAGQAGCPYKEVFFHRSCFIADVDVTALPSRDIVFEFTLAPEASRDGCKWAAADIAPVSSYFRNGNGHRK